MNSLAASTMHGVPWYTAHNGMGYRNGYARIPKGHPWFVMPKEIIPITVHGGLTYANKGPPAKVPNFSYSWWVGFDCMRILAGDAPDPALWAPEYKSMVGFLEEHLPGLRTIVGGGTVRTEEFAETECISMCKQIIAAATEHAHDT